MKKAILWLFVSLLLINCNSKEHNSISKKEITEMLGKYQVYNIADILNNGWSKTKFLGITLFQYPNDMWMIQEIITEIKPDYIIETGTLYGGSALYYATILEQVNPKGKVITIDIAPAVDAALKNIESNQLLYNRVKTIFQKYIEIIVSNSVDPKLISSLSERVKDKKVIVALDSCHNCEHVLKELELYSPLVSAGSYIIVGDTAIDRTTDLVSKDEKEKFLKYFSLCPGYTKTGGPGKGADEFLSKNKNFIADGSRNRFLETYYPSGFLKRIK